MCSGDGSVGWVLSEIDRLNMHVSVIIEFIFNFLFLYVTGIIKMHINQLLVDIVFKLI